MASNRTVDLISYQFLCFNAEIPFFCSAIEVQLPLKSKFAFLISWIFNQP